MINSNLSKENNVVSEQLIKLKGELNILDERINYIHNQYKILPLDTIK